MKLIGYILVIYMMVFSVLAVRNHDLYQTFGWDLGFFDQLIWQASRGNLNFISTIGKINLIGDHFQPVVYLLAPLYWIWDDVRVLLIAQVILMSMAAVPLYLLALRKLKSEKLAVATAVAYLLFTGTQFTITNEFHQSAFIPLLLSLGFYWIEIGEKKKGLMAWLGLLLIREEMALLLTALGLMYLIKKELKFGLKLIVIGLVSFWLLLKVVIPAVSSQGKYIHYGYGETGETPGEVAKFMITNPMSTIDQLVNPAEKRRQVIGSIMSFGGLPILSPVRLLPVAEQYAVRFLDTRNVHRWRDRNHYAAPLGPLLAVATIAVLGQLKKKYGRDRKNTFETVAASYLLLAAILGSYFRHGPITTIFKPQLYETPQWARNVDKLIDSIPEGVALATNNSVAPHLTHRDKLYLLPNIGDAWDIVVDLSEGPNKNAPWSHARMRGYISQLRQEGWCDRERIGLAFWLERCEKSQN